MTLNAATVREVAHLARLELTEAEVEQFTRQLNDILRYVAKLNEVDTSGVPPLAYVLTGQPAFREDEVQPSLPLAEVLANAPQKNQNFFLVPRII